VLTAKCGTELDHGVLVVGYGVDDKTGVDYWKIKNDFGIAFGEQGYARIERGVKQKGGQCGLLLDATYPVLA
jgi:KDEL-tailed cysteine endopeptidase